MRDKGASSLQGKGPGVRSRSPLWLAFGILLAVAAGLVAAARGSVDVPLTTVIGVVASYVPGALTSARKYPVLSVVTGRVVPIWTSTPALPWFGAAATISLRAPAGISRTPRSLPSTANFC